MQYADVMAPPRADADHVRRYEQDLWELRTLDKARRIDRARAHNLAVALSINVGSALVDVSPLSTLGALCVAAVADPIEARDLFRKLLVWGLSMAIVGAVLCGLLAGPFARA